MWISKKKLNEKLREERWKSFQDEQENEQWTKIYKLERQVKKLKKQVKNGY